MTTKTTPPPPAPPSVSELEAVASAWGDTGALTVPAGFTTGKVSTAAEVADGSKGEVFKDSAGNIIISFEDAYAFTKGADTKAFAAASAAAEASILSGATPAALADAVALAQAVIAANPNKPIYVTGVGGLAGVEAEAVAAALGAKISGGATFGAPGLPGNSSVGTGTLVDYVDYGDPIGNYASDNGESPLASVALSTMNHYGIVTMVGNPAETADLNLLATDLTAPNGSNGFSGAATSTVPAALEIFTTNTQLYHGFDAYVSDVSGAPAPPTPDSNDLAAVSADLASGLVAAYGVGTTDNAVVSNALKASAAAKAVPAAKAAPGPTPIEALSGNGVTVDVYASGEVTLTQSAAVSGNPAGTVDIVTDPASGTAAAVAGAGVKLGAAADNGLGAYTVTDTGVTVDAYADASLGFSTSVTAPSTDTVNTVTSTPPAQNVPISNSEDYTVTSAQTNITITNPNIGTTGPITVTVIVPNGLSPVTVAADTLTIDGYSIAGALPVDDHTGETTTYVQTEPDGTTLGYTYVPPTGNTANVGDGTLTVADAAGDTVIIQGFNQNEFGVSLGALGDLNDAIAKPVGLTSATTSHRLAQAIAGFASSSGGLSSAAPTASTSTHLATLAVAGGHGQA